VYWFQSSECHVFSTSLVSVISFQLSCKQVKQIRHSIVLLKIIQSKWDTGWKNRLLRCTSSLTSSLVHSRFSFFVRRETKERQENNREKKQYSALVLTSQRTSESTKWLNDNKLERSSVQC